MGLFDEENRQKRSYDRFDAFVGPFLLAGAVLVSRWFLFGMTSTVGSETLETLFPAGLAAYLISDGRWWLTAALMTFAGMSGLLLHRAQIEWKHYQKWTGSVIEGLAGFVAFGAAAVFGLLRYF